MKITFILMQIKLIFTRKVLHCKLAKLNLSSECTRWWDLNLYERECTFTAFYSPGRTSVPPKIAVMKDYLKNDPLASCCSNQSQIQIFIPACVGIFDYNSSAFGQIKKSLNG